MCRADRLISVVELAIELAIAAHVRPFLVN